MEPVSVKIKPLSSENFNSQEEQQQKQEQRVSRMFYATRLINKQYK